jgi:hypothetical protein
MESMKYLRSLFVVILYRGLVWFGLGFDSLAVCRFNWFASVSASHGVIFPIDITPNHAPSIAYLVAHAPNHGLEVFPHGSE